MRAFCLIRDEPSYRRMAFVNGLRAAGYDVKEDCSGMETSGKDDALVIWNRYGDKHAVATRFEKRGGIVFVAENAYIANDRNNRRRYAIALRAHLGLGKWWPQGTERWDDLRLELKPWQKNGDGHVLVLPNRSFGIPGFMMPPMWPELIGPRLRKVTQRRIVIRPHPGNGTPTRSLADDLSGAHAAVVWTSSSGYEALMSGIPVFCEASWWIGFEASNPDITQIESPKYDDEARLRVFQKLAWAQWSVEEIERGEPFQHLRDHSPALADCV